MSPIVSFLLLSSTLALLSIARGQERAPHGIAYENPMAFSPSAYEFFHPKNQDPEKTSPCDESSCSPLPVAAQVETAAQALESKVLTPPTKGGNRMGAGGIAGLLFGLAFVVLLAMGAYYVLVTRRANMSRENTVQPDA